MKIFKTGTSHVTCGFIVAYMLSSCLPLNASDNSIELVDSKKLSEWEGVVIPNTEFMHSGTKSFELFGKYPTELISAQMIPVDMNKTYTLSAWMRTLDAKLPASGCLGLRMYDKDKHPITIVNVGAFAGTESSLAKDAVKGSKELYLRKNPKCLSITTSVIMFNIKDDYKDLPNYDNSSIISEMIDEGDIYKVVLSSPLTKFYPAGTRTRLHTPWGAPFYWLTEGWQPAEWTNFTNTMKGMAKSGTPDDKFWAGTKYVRVFVWFGNWNHKPEKGAKLLIDDIRFTEKD